MLSLDKKIFSLLALITYIFSFCSPSMAQEFVSPDSAYQNQTTLYVESAVENTTKAEASTTSSEACDPICPAAESNSSQGAENSSSESGSPESQTQIGLDSNSSNSTSGENNTTANASTTTNNNANTTAVTDFNSDTDSAEHTATTPVGQTAGSTPNSSANILENAGQAEVVVQQNGGNQPEAPNQQAGQDQKNIVVNPEQAQVEYPAGSNLDTVTINFIYLANGQVNWPATLAATKTRINQYFEEGKTESAGKLILQLMQNDQLKTAEIDAYISKIINGYRTSGGKTIAADTKTATTLILNFFRFHPSSAQITRYLNILMTRGDADGAERVILAANNDLLLSSSQLKTYIANFIGAKQLDRAARIIVDTIQIGFLTSTEIETYVNQFLARGAANQSRTASPENALKIIMAATDAWLFSSDKLRTYINHFITEDYLDQATRVILRAIRMYFISTAEIVKYLDQLLARGAANRNRTVSEENAASIIVAATDAHLFSSATLGTYIDHFMKANDLDRAARIIVDVSRTYYITSAQIARYLNQFLAIGVANRNRPVSVENAIKILIAATDSDKLNSAQLKTYIDHFMTLNEPHQAASIIIAMIPKWLLSSAQILKYLDQFLARGTANQNRHAFPDEAEKIIIAANSLSILNSTQLKTYIDHFMTTNDHPRAERIIVDAIPKSWLISEVQIVSYLNQFLTGGNPKQNRPVSPEIAITIIMAANDTRRLSFAQVKPYIDHFIRGNDLGRATRIIVNAIEAQLMLPAQINSYLDLFLARGAANKDRVVSPESAEKIYIASLSASKWVTLTAAQAKTYIDEFIKLGHTEIAKRLIIQTRNVQGLMSAAQFRSYIDQFLAVGSFSKNTIQMNAAKDLILEALNISAGINAVVILTKAQVKSYLTTIFDRNERSAARDIAKKALDVGIFTEAEARPFI